MMTVPESPMNGIGMTVGMGMEIGMIVEIGIDHHHDD
jgi:hypothetical protein